MAASAARHTYDGLAFLPGRGVMLAQGGATAGRRWRGAGANP